jgi:hypothetical protein
MDEHKCAFPVFDGKGDADYQCTDSGLTAKQYAAIHLKVPRSGDPEIDAMIRESRRTEFAEAAMRIVADKIMTWPDSLRHNCKNYLSQEYIGLADALIAELEECHVCNP